MATQDDFRADVEAFLERHDMRAASFGTQALKDPKFVFDLRNGRSPSLKTIDRVRQWMAEYDAAHPPETPPESGTRQTRESGAAPWGGAATGDQETAPGESAAQEAAGDETGDEDGAAAEAAAPPEATEPSSPPPEKATRRRLWPVVLLFLVSLLIIAVGVAYTYRPGIIRAGLSDIRDWLAGEEPAAPPMADSRYTELMALINAVQDDYNGLRDDMARLEQRVEGMETRLASRGDGDTAASSALADRVARLQGELDRLSSRLASRDPGATSRLGDQLSGVDSRLSGVEDRLGRLAARVQEFGDIRTDVSRAALVAAFMRLDAAVRRGDPYGAVLALFRERLTAGGPSPPTGDGEALEPLAVHADSGVATRAALGKRFAERIPDILGTAAAEDSWWDRLLGRARGLVSIRKTGPVEGDDPGAVVARAENALAAGELAGAVAELDGLPPARRAVLADWFAAAEARLAAEAALDRLAAGLAPASGAG